MHGVRKVGQLVFKLVTLTLDGWRDEVIGELSGLTWDVTGDAFWKP